MLDIKWNTPQKIKENGIFKYRREWNIPNELKSGFFIWWRSNKFKYFSSGFSVQKKNNNWYLTETKISADQFKKFEDYSQKKDHPMDDDFGLTPLPVKNINGLRPWQIDVVGLIIAALEKWGCAIDGSEMGVGKTYSAIGVVRELDIPFVVVCPKAVISQWQNVINNHFKLKDKCIGIINYESLIRGHKDSNIASYIKKRATQRNEFLWKLPKDSSIIWDEAHKLKNWKTQNSKTCISAYKQGYKQIFLSASIATTPLELRTIGMCLKLFKNAKEYYEFLFNNGCSKGIWGITFNNDKNVLLKIHKNLFNKRGVRLKRDSIPNFPECEIEIEPYNMNDETTKKINKIYEEMNLELKKIEEKIKNDSENELTIRIRARQRCEFLKIPLIQEMVEESVESGMSVVVFLNFSESIDALAQRLNTKCIFDGRVGDKIREQNKTSAGGVGLSIGDELGGFPRVSIISPDDSAVKMKQVLGRTVRENSKSKSLIKFVFVSGTIEEKVSNNVKQKLNNLSLINDGDLKPY